MTPLKRFFRRLVNLVTRRYHAERLREEVEAHLAALTEEYIRAGMAPQEAARQARLKFGSPVSARASYYDEATLPLLEDLLQDGRYTLRLLRRSLGFTVVAVVSLMLGIGATTAIFSLVNAVLLRPLSYPQSDRLMAFVEFEPGKENQAGTAAISYPRYQFIRDQQDCFSSLGAAIFESFTLSGHGAPIQLYGYFASPTFLQTLGVQPAHGHLFSSQEDRPGTAQVAVLSQNCWQKHFASDPSVVGRTVTLNNAPYTIVGVLARPLAPPLDQADVFAPGVLNSSRYPPAMLRQGTSLLFGIARLKPGITPEQASAALRSLSVRYRQAYLDHVDAATGQKVASLQELVVGWSRPRFYILAGAVGCVLLIACVNVANLSLARLESRRREIAIRVALGAGRWRLTQQLITESLLLNLLAGILGSFFAAWCVHLARGLGPEVIPRAREIHLDGAALLFTLVMSLLTGVLLGVFPASRIASDGMGKALQQSATLRDAGATNQGRVQATLLIAQVALSLVLLACTGLLLSSLWRLQRVRLGFDPDGVVMASVYLPARCYPNTEQQAAFFAQVTRNLRTLPGVQDAAAALYGPMTGALEMYYSVVGQPTPAASQRAHTICCYASPDYFATLGIPILQGRTFSERDRTGMPPVMLINETMARQLFPHGDALGQKLLCSAMDPVATEIVGIVADARTIRVSELPKPEMYFSMYQRSGLSMNVYVRAINPEQVHSLRSSIEAAVHSVDPEQPVGESLEMNTLVSRSIANRKLTALLVAGFASLALVLAGVGIYGLTAYGVAQRTREIGIRMALGAHRYDVLRFIIVGSMKPVLAGIIIGMSIALGMARLLANSLYGVSENDPLTFVAVVLVLMLVALLASYLPTRRATQVDPLAALREG